MAVGPLRSLVEFVEVLAFGGGDVRIRHDGDADCGEGVLPGEALGESREVAFDILVERTREVVGVRGGGGGEEEEEEVLSRSKSWLRTKERLIPSPITCPMLQIAKFATP